MSATVFNAVRAAARRIPVVPKPSTAAAPRFYSSSMHDHDPDTLETEKRRNLTGKQHKTSTPHEEHAPGWNEYLASASEAAVKADQAPSLGGPAAMQERTVTRIKHRYEEEESTEPESAEKSRATQEQGMNTSRMGHGETVHAVYEREEIDGPLGSAGGHKSVEVEEVTKSKPATGPAK
ncbi:hypothetical protein DAEQUDRAFT_762415 [Daedalea quercina L-15889]|uniref:Uncharacterized protein n=1 Tax=Daedalea quercina L-15889 TaxID=1314783 RepID=A0A165T7X7_9APHY|nr:hypothetical protein DAEQUDRAFT_762415 [Daedalea quercina L-15889]